MTKETRIELLRMGLGQPQIGAAGLRRLIASIDAGEPVLLDGYIYLDGEG